MILLIFVAIYDSYHTTQLDKILSFKNHLPLAVLGKKLLLSIWNQLNYQWSLKKTVH